MLLCQAPCVTDSRDLLFSAYYSELSASACVDGLVCALCIWSCVVCMSSASAVRSVLQCAPCGSRQLIYAAFSSLCQDLPCWCVPGASC